MKPYSDPARLSQLRFLQNASHALQTPLMIISGYAQGVQQGRIPPAEASEIILDQCGKLSLLIDQILRFSHLEDRVGDTSLKSLSLGQAVRCFLDRFRFASGETRITFSPLSGPDDAVLISEELLELILDNLLTNAARYAREKIAVLIRQDAQSICLSVADDGEGIPPQDYPYLFDLLYKGRNGQHGLGLPLARLAAEAMDAELSAANGPNGGAVFTLRLHRSTRET